MACQAPALYVPVGCACPASAQWETSLRTGLMEHPELFTPTREATVPLTELTPATWNLKTQHTNPPLPWTWSILRNLQISAPTTAKLALWELLGEHATALLRASMDVSCCAVDVGLRPGLRLWLNAATAPSTGAAMSAAWTAPAHGRYTSVYDHWWTNPVNIRPIWGKKKNFLVEQVAWLMAGGLRG